jgi:hypothetical protein
MNFELNHKSVLCAQYERTVYYNDGKGNLPIKVVGGVAELFKLPGFPGKYTFYGRTNKRYPFKDRITKALLTKYQSGKKLSLAELTNCYTQLAADAPTGTATVYDFGNHLYHHGFPTFLIMENGKPISMGLNELLNYSTSERFHGDDEPEQENLTIFVPNNQQQLENMGDVTIKGDDDDYYENTAITKVSCQHAKRVADARVTKDETIINLNKFEGYIVNFVVTYIVPGTSHHPSRLAVLKINEHTISDHEFDFFFNLMLGVRGYEEYLKDGCKKIHDEEEIVELRGRALDDEIITKEEGALEDLKEKVNAEEERGIMFYAAIMELIEKLKNSKLITDQKHYNKFTRHLNFIVSVAKQLPPNLQLLIKQALMSGSSTYKPVPSMSRAVQMVVNELSAAAPAMVGKLESKGDAAKSRRKQLLRDKKAQNPRVPAPRPPTKQKTLDELLLESSGASDADDFMDDDDDDDDDDGAEKRRRVAGGARKKRKTKRRKNKKLKKTYKKRRSTKNKRRR